VKKITLYLAPAIALASCNEEPPPAAEATTTEASAVEPESAEPALPAPNQALFTELHAAACPNARPVNIASCKRAGMGSENVICEYGLGEDEYLRNKATLTAGDGEWTLTDVETVCATGA